MLTMLSLIMSVNIFILCFVFSEMNFLTNTNSFPLTKDTDMPHRFLEETKSPIDFCFYYKDTIKITTNAEEGVYLKQNDNIIKCTGVETGTETTTETSQKIYECKLEQLGQGNVDVFVDENKKRSFVSTDFKLDSSTNIKINHDTLILHDVKCKPQTIIITRQQDENPPSHELDCTLTNEILNCPLNNLKELTEGGSYNINIKYKADGYFSKESFTLSQKFEYYKMIDQKDISIQLPSKTNRGINQIIVTFTESLINKKVNWVDISQNQDSVTLIIKEDKQPDNFVVNNNEITIQINCRDNIIYTIKNIYFDDYTFLQFSSDNYSFGYFFRFCPLII